MFPRDDEMLLMTIGRLLRVYSKQEVIDVLRNRAEEIEDGKIRLSKNDPDSVEIQ